MIATTSGPDLAFFDGHMYALMVTVRRSDGLVEIQHQADNDHVADQQMARLAAEIIDQLGPRAVVEQLVADDLGIRDLAPMTVEPPLPGQAVMRCRCGRMLDLRQMRRFTPPRYVQPDCVVIRPIVCPACAA